MLGILGGEGKQENKNEVQEMENYGAEAGSAVKLLEELLNLGHRKNASLSGTAGRPDGCPDEAGRHAAPCAGI